MASTKARVTCADCYFRRAQLCALAGDEICPTFRLAVRDMPERPRQAQLVPLPRRRSAVAV